MAGAGASGASLTRGPGQLMTVSGLILLLIVASRLIGDGDHLLLLLLLIDSSSSSSSNGARPLAWAQAPRW